MGNTTAVPALQCVKKLGGRQFPTALHQTIRRGLMQQTSNHHVRVNVAHHLLKMTSKQDKVEHMYRAYLRALQLQLSSAAGIKSTVEPESSAELFIDDSDLGESHQNIQQRPFSSMSQLKLTKPAPEWSGTALVNGEFKDLSLADYRGKYLVFFFYPCDFTFICPTEIISFSERVQEFQAINCEVVGVSTDSQHAHLAWVNTPRKQGGLGNMNIPLLSDNTHAISKAYGCLKEDEGVAFRALFIIDGAGNLRQITMNDLPVGRSVDETLRLVQAFQFTDKHGEVCPANWKPGSDTMKPDPKGSKTYFAKHN